MYLQIYYFYSIENLLDCSEYPDQNFRKPRKAPSPDAPMFVYGVNHQDQGCNFEGIYRNIKFCMHWDNCRKLALEKASSKRAQWDVEITYEI